MRRAWKSVDIDRSDQRLEIALAAFGYRLMLFDEGASICGLDPSGEPINSLISARSLIRDRILRLQI